MGAAESIGGQGLADTAAVEVLGVGAAAAVGEVFGTAELGLLVFDQMLGNMHLAEEREEYGSGRIGLEIELKVADFVVVEEDH